MPCVHGEPVPTSMFHEPLAATMSRMMRCRCVMMLILSKLVMLDTMHVPCQLEPYRYFLRYAQVIHTREWLGYWHCR